MLYVAKVTQDQSPKSREIFCCSRCHCSGRCLVAPHVLEAAALSCPPSLFSRRGGVPAIASRLERAHRVVDRAIQEARPHPPAATHDASLCHASCVGLPHRTVGLGHNLLSPT